VAARPARGSAYGTPRAACAGKCTGMHAGAGAGSWPRRVAACFRRRSEAAPIRLRSWSVRTRRDVESEDAGVPPLEPERPIERAAGVLRLASGQVDARRACCPGFRDRVLHEGSADTASSVIRSHDEVIEIRLRAGQGRNTHRVTMPTTCIPLCATYVGASRATIEASLERRRSRRWTSSWSSGCQGRTVTPTAPLITSLHDVWVTAAFVGILRRWTRR